MTQAKANPTIPKDQLVGLYRQALMSGVPLSKVETKIGELWHRNQTSQRSETAWDKDRQTQLTNQVPRWIRLGAMVVPIMMIMVGMSLVGSAVVPILGYYVTELPQLQARELTTPIPADGVLDANPVVITKVVPSTSSRSEEVIDPIILDSPLDYTNLSNWFGATSPELLQGKQAQQTYTIDIPSLNISNAEVTVGGTNLNKSLIQYPGTALPGESGAPVIFGHSVLRQFYNPSEKNPRRYNSIFSTIMTLKKGDKIYITQDNVKYTYIVQDKTEVKPEDTYILAQKYDHKQLKLVTCTPEGTYLRRGVITAVLATE